MFTLSVVVPNYNNSKFLDKCIRSIVNQDYSGLIEVIIVDDCSTDNSRDVIKCLTEEFVVVRPVFLSKNGGVSAARNVGLYLAKGEYISFIDADDFYENNEKLRYEMTLIQKHREKGEDIISYSKTITCSNDGKTFFDSSIKDDKFYEGDAYSRFLLDINSGMVIRDYCVLKDIVKMVGGYNSSNCLFEDYELLLKLSKILPIYYTFHKGTVYRHSINGLSKRTPKELRKKKETIIFNEINTNKGVKKVFYKLVRKVIVGCKTIKNFLKVKI